MKYIISTLVLGLLLASCTVGIVHREELEIRLLDKSPIPTATLQPVASPTPTATFQLLASPTPTATFHPVANPTPEPSSGQAWHIETIDDNARDGGSLVLDSCGYPHISYQSDTPSTYYDIKYAHWTGSQWLIEKVADADFGGSSALALDGSASPHVAYIACNPYYCAIRYAQRTDDEWAVTDWDIAGGVPSLAIDANGQPHASYRRSYQGVRSSLEYAYWTGSDWLTETLDSSIGNYPALQLDNDGHPHISYSGKYLKYAHWTGSEWAFSIIDGDIHAGQYTSLALDSDDHPHISYQDMMNYSLEYTVWTGSAWNTQTVDNAGNVGRFSSLALDTFGHPHIAYSDDTNNAVKYARWTGSEWQIDVIETGAGDEYAISLALDGENQPHISYYDYGDPDDHALKYATTSSVLTLADVPCIPAALPTDTPTPTPFPTLTPASASVELVGHFLQDAADISLHDNLAYINDNKHMDDGKLLTVMDVSDPIRPAIVSQAGIDVNIVQVVDDYAYAIGMRDCERSGGGCRVVLQILDASDPSALIPVGAYTWPQHWQMPWAVRIAVLGHAIYVADFSTGFLVLDASDPTAPVEVSRQEGYTWGVALVDHYAYVLHSHDDWEQGYYQVLDVSNPTEPVEVATYDVSEYEWGSSPNVVIADGYAYFSTGRGSLDIVDVSNPTAPFKVGSYDIPEDFGPGFITELVVADGYAYLGCFYSGNDLLRVLDVSNPALPREVGSREFYGPLRGLAAVDGVIYVACGESAYADVIDEGGIFILRYTGPEP